MSKRHAVYQVTFLTGVAPGKKKVQAEEVILGRVDGCTLVIEHKDVSRRHLSVKMMYGQVVIEDLGSSNGTFLNGNELNPKTPTVVGPNDVISLGRHVVPTTRVRPLSRSSRSHATPSATRSSTAGATTSTR